MDSLAKMLYKVFAVMFDFNTSLEMIHALRPSHDAQINSYGH